jgi:hypothetical protein
MVSKEGDALVKQQTTSRKEERTTIHHQPEPERLTDLHQHGSADAADLRERYHTLQNKETPLSRVRDEFFGAFDEHTGEEHHHEYDR